ncbi:MAG: hypothetical protein H7308_09375 [Chthonomonadaceae bacterium]|nr:hypothetical protein [Chthonomonadaceae bacterium]
MSDNFIEAETSSSEHEPDLKTKRSLWGKVAIVALVLFLSNLPYLYAFLKREDRIYLGIGFNFDDVCVYLSWIRQAAGATPLHVFNVFTTQPQNGMIANPLFLLLGLISRVTTLSPILVFHLSRLVFGGLLFWRLEKLLGTLSILSRNHVLIFALVAFSSGLGWLPGLWERDGIASPIDRWQPEAITFLSLLLNPLFLASLCLQISIFDFLLRAEREKTRLRIRLSFTAGFLAALLTLIHTYDLISVSLAWSLYGIARLVSKGERESKIRLVSSTLIASLLPLPALFWMIAALRSDALFSARAAVETPSPSPLWIALGYGLVSLLAFYALLAKRVSNIENDLSKQETSSQHLFLSLWSLGQFIALYLPVPFQRKMIQGLHLPLAILAGVAIPLFWERVMKKGGRTKISFPFFATFAVAILSLSNLRFLLREMSNSDNNLVQTGQHRAYITEPEWKTIEWLRANTKPGESLQALPWLALISAPNSDRRFIGVQDMTLPLLIPALTGLPAYCAHFGETPNFGAKLSNLSSFTSGKMPLEKRLAFKKEMNTTYLLFTQTPAIVSGSSEIAATAERVFRETTATDRLEPSPIQTILTHNVR